MSDIAGKMAEWRKTLWGTGPCPDSSQKNFTLSDAEREAVERAIKTLDGWQQTGGYHSAIEDDAATLRGLLERLGGGR